MGGQWTARSLKPATTTHLFERVILIVLDGIGVGALPDAWRYGDDGANSLLHCAEEVDGLPLPTMDQLGLSWILRRRGDSQEEGPRGHFGRMQEASAGKDTLTGHWEMVGVILKEPFSTFPNGIPKPILEAFCRETGHDVLGGYPASGTAILESLGEEHLRTRRPIVYTSADSVFQIAAHVQVFSLEELYALCEKAREITKPYRLARVIARPFAGEPGRFVRTKERRDFALPPPSDTVLDRLEAHCLEVLGIGKIHDIFAGRGVSRTIPTHSNSEGLAQILCSLEDFKKGLIFANLNDFDTLHGHRRNPQGYADALRELDGALPEILKRMGGQDLLVLTSDHGCDPTFHGTDHTREYVPLLVYHTNPFQCCSLGIRKSFSDLAATLADVFSIDWPGPGISFSALFRGR